ncbi:aminotransferase class I/II-fold pyridoxal phosphate-dependent enzyme [Clostridioides sp. ZZV14-6154]|uniref:pyridoxal phosphate-dependent aminotransferase n=1 Tax=unclassified Clostridioides TaxID=2635829 RepID=UPI001D11E3A2|nr:aminotransferase class I/II-fold pyridoxal phosphate-dependent enzyme [Clostridioides sp. ZZV14-6150]MCC0661649.1 aminotransferase class I/II-fold pyridoxal phosphate-dependent enzyme [Clostridioides sp. ZZV14-6154]MCC0669454.1 aminotransferase class I/II-fold pyridoxal phosphate-dependent enzyme [Clostridioides sp. ZZV14-6153]MCC0731343.1 aminotransferase class I/II-fold pyridoxal phosphate-dependent enzyme [Clostridioides sp. ZZV14-6048]MCC0735660.1 aminotransferase class I/II-fold pyridox
MKDLGHGANVDEMAKLYGKDPKEIIDFSSNINPKVLPNLEKYILRGLDECRNYPDINYTNLRKNISKYININPNFIIPGNGATEIIYLLMKSIKKRLAIINPTFSEYRRSAKLNNIDIIDLELDSNNNFKLDIDTVKNKIEKFDSLFICNPNNPSGNVQDLKELVCLLNENNKMLIIDETFMEFVENENEYSLVKYIESNKNIFIIKAVTKFFGMPGLRLGYGLTSNSKIMDKIYEYKEPWTINSFADMLSNFIFEDKDYIRNSKEFYIKERKYMLQELKDIRNIKVYDTDANFILIKLYKKIADELKKDLFKRGNILVRDASNFIGLDDSFIRIAIKSHEDNKILIENIKNLLGD